MGDSLFSQTKIITFSKKHFSIFFVGYFILWKSLAPLFNGEIEPNSMTVTQYLNGSLTVYVFREFAPKFSHPNFLNVMLIHSLSRCVRIVYIGQHYLRKDINKQLCLCFTRLKIFFRSILKLLASFLIVFLSMAKTVQVYLKDSSISLYSFKYLDA